MILDIPKHPEHAVLYDVIDLDTGGPLDVFYADDEAGIYRVHRHVGEGPVCYLLDPITGEIAWEERRGRIKVVPRAESPRPRSPLK